MNTEAGNNELRNSGYPMTVDLFLFMGQSNMAGRGIVTADHPQGAPELIDGAGYEYRAVSAPDRLYPICEPFGRLGNRPGGIDDKDMKTGSLVTSFVNAYYEKTRVPIVALSLVQICDRNLHRLRLHGAAAQRRPSAFSYRKSHTSSFLLSAK